MNKQQRLYIEMQTALHKWLKNNGNDEADWQDFLKKSTAYKGDYEADCLLVGVYEE